MKRLNGKLNGNCSRIEHLIIRQMTSNINDKEKELVDDHLKTCKKCRQFRQILMRISSSFASDALSELSPSPDVRLNLIHEMEMLQRAEKSFADKISDALYSLFTYRIPVYQFVLAIILIFGIFFGKSIFFQPQNPVTFPSDASITKNEIIVDQPKIRAHLQIVNRQKTGESIKEDSVLTKFIVTTL
ncbi:MAG: hypothetical protein GXO77_14135 [Calditrichaeota bacterium]|nr:hypothetical protein [Calditrichota bacterium]